jgi:predicted NBD/HSP70 family sugar kinase
MKDTTTRFIYSVGKPHRTKGRTRGSNQAAVRLYNERLALSLIRRQGGVSKAEIARQTGLSAQTISVILKQLEAAELVRAGEPLRGQVGQPRIPFFLNPDGALFFGLKIGRRSSDLILMDFIGTIKDSIRETYPYPQPENIMKFVRDGVAAIKAKLKSPLVSRIVGIGVGYPYELWNWGEEVGAPKEVMDQWRGFDFDEQIESIAGMPTLIGNDATNACAAELVFGNVSAYQNFLYFFIGTFIGGGVVLGGDLFVGPQGNAGAIGSMPMEAPDSGHGARQLISAASIYTLEKRLAVKGQDPSAIWKSPESWRTLSFEVDRWIEEVSAAIAFAIVSAISIIDFEAIVIDGAFPSEIRRRILAGSAKALEKMNLQGASAVVLTEGILGSKARAVGGACLPLLANFFPDNQVLRKAVGE